MTPHDRAVQIWQVLIAAAHEHRIVTSKTVADLIGVPAEGMPQPLDHLAQHCVRNGWPPITALVASGTTADAGGAADAAETLAADRQRVFEHHWFGMRPLAADGPGTSEPSGAVDQPAKRPCPKCGRLGNAAATLCGYCWTRLSPVVLDSKRVVVV